MGRARDKEPTIRVQAISALSQLCSVENPDELADGELSATEIILGIMNHDPSAYVLPLLTLWFSFDTHFFSFSDVRKAALINVRLTPETLRAIIIRTRDQDTNVRKAVYASVLANHITVLVGENQTEVMGLTHPRGMTIAQRETIIRNGLGDRQPVVKASAEKLVAAWVDVAGASMEPKQEDGDALPQAENTTEQAFLSLLNMFDLAEGKVAEDALISVFKNRLDLFDTIEFGGKTYLSIEFVY